MLPAISSEPGLRSSTACPNLQHPDATIDGVALAPPRPCLGSPRGVAGEGAGRVRARRARYVRFGARGPSRPSRRSPRDPRHRRGTRIPGGGGRRSPRPLPGAGSARSRGGAGANEAGRHPPDRSRSGEAGPVDRYDPDSHGGSRRSRRRRRSYARAPGCRGCGARRRGTRPGRAGVRDCHCRPGRLLPREAVEPGRAPRGRVRHRGASVGRHRHR